MKGSGVATVVTDSDGQLVVNSPDPNTILEHITNNEIDTMMGKIVVPDEDKSVTIDPSLSNPGQVADAKATGDAIREEVERATRVENEIKADINNRFAAQNILVGTETGNPLAVDDAFAAPLCGLSVYGKSTQDGTPSPDAPVPIVSAGDGGSIAVKVTGKNRMPPNLKYDDVTECYVKKNTPITLVFKGNLVSQGGNILFYDEDNNQCWFGIDKGKAVHHITYTVNLTKFKYLLSDMASENVCLTWSASSPDYEPYREQLLTLPTPTGLPGIPVKSGGNYTDQSGQQWVCDEVDLERGVKVQRLGKAEVVHVEVSKDSNWYDATKSYSYEITKFTYPFSDNDANVQAEFCNRFEMFKFGNFYNKGIETGGLLGHAYAVFNISKSLGICTTANEFKAWFNENVVLYKILATPIEKPLTPAEIAAYKALTAYGPDTVVQAGDGAGIKLDYQRDVNVAIKRIEDAIASMT